MPDVPRLPTDLFRFTAVDRAEVYTAVLHVFGQANERLETALGLDDIARRLNDLGWFAGPNADALLDVLKQLGDWRLLDITQNPAGQYRTAEEYERRNLQYSLTRHGEAALAGMEHAAAVLTATGALQTAVLDAIGDRLAELARLLKDPAAPDRRVFTALQELENHLDGLRTNTKQFNGQLQRLLRADGAEYATFHEVKGATVAYLQEFLVNLDSRVFRLAEAVGAVEGEGVDRLFRRALNGAELPSFGGDDPAPAWLQHRQTRWDGVRAWFRPLDGSEPRVHQLNAIARRAIVTLLQALDRITESRRRASSAANDLRELARWFQAAPTDDDLHLVWSTAFGLGSSRHAHLTHPDPELVPHGIPWDEAPPVHVSALLRTSGRTERFSRTAQVPDVAATKRERAARVRQQRIEQEAVWRLMVTDGPVRLSGFGRVEPATLDRLLELLSAALAAAPKDGVRTGLTTDGQLRVTLHPPADGAVAVLHTVHGRFTSPDYLVQIEATKPTAAREETA